MFYFFIFSISISFPVHGINSKFRRPGVLIGEGSGVQQVRGKKIVIEWDGRWMRRLESLWTYLPYIGSFIPWSLGFLITFATFRLCQQCQLQSIYTSRPFKNHEFIIHLRSSVFSKRWYQNRHKNTSPYQRPMKSFLPQWLIPCKKKEDNFVK